jgi:glycosyltransferase involved in cell wall biosynthesis
MLNDLPSISIIIPVLNDNEELNLTIQSIRETSPENVEIIVIDDGSDIPVKLLDGNVKLFRFNQRKGAGQSRHFGAINASSKHLLFIDAHMRFDKNWFNNAMERITSTPKTLWCGSCLGLNETNMDMSKPRGLYTGANLVLYAEKNKTIFDGVWRKDEKNKDDYEISCVMGACYFIHKDWYFYIKGLEQTMMWGSEEPILSIKTWLAGGEVRLMKSVRLGHKFRDTSPYSTNISHIYYNKLAYMYMLLPDDLNMKLRSKFVNNGNYHAALNLIEENKLILTEEKRYYQSIFQYDIYWLCNKFQIDLKF